MEVVYGATIEALEMAAQKSARIILDDNTPPPPFASRREEWGRLYLQLMLSGQTLGGDSVTGCRVTDHDLHVISKPNIIMSFPYTKLYVFSDKKIIGLPAPIRQNKQFQVVDHLHGVSLSVPHIDYIKTHDKFVNEVFVLKLVGLLFEASIFTIIYTM